MTRYRTVLIAAAALAAVPSAADANDGALYPFGSSIWAVGSPFTTAVSDGPDLPDPGSGDDGARRNALGDELGLPGARERDRGGAVQRPPHPGGELARGPGRRRRRRHMGRAGFRDAGLPGRGAAVRDPPRPRRALQRPSPADADRDARAARPRLLHRGAAHPRPRHHVAGRRHPRHDRQLDRGGGHAARRLVRERQLRQRRRRPAADPRRGPGAVGRRAGRRRPRPRPGARRRAGRRAAGPDRRRGRRHGRRLPPSDTNSVEPDRAAGHRPPGFAGRTRGRDPGLAVTTRRAGRRLPGPDQRGDGRRDLRRVAGRRRAGRRRRTVGDRGTARRRRRPRLRVVTTDAAGNTAVTAGPQPVAVVAHAGVQLYNVPTGWAGRLDLDLTATDALQSVLGIGATEVDDLNAATDGGESGEWLHRSATRPRRDGGWCRSRSPGSPPGATRCGSRSATVGRSRRWPPRCAPSWR